MRTLRLSVAACCLGWLLTACTPAPVSDPPEPAAPEAKGRVVILGFDGVEPAIVDAMLDAGRLPNLAALRDQGTYARLQSTIPPQSPAAWSSFATGTNPGDHGVFDFIHREPANYAPMPGVGVLMHAEFFPDGEFKRGPSAMNFRTGEAFWKTADRQGVRSTLIHIPFAFPPDELSQSLMLPGAGVPEIGGHNTHFCHLSDAFTPEQLADQPLGGVRIPLAFEGDTATVDIPGAMSMAGHATGKRVTVPLTVEADRTARTLTLRVHDQEITVAEGEWSDWTEWTFDVTSASAVQALGIFYVLEAGEQVRLYLSSMQFHPEAPYVPLTSPEDYSKELVDRYGLYKTLGWSHDTSALRADALDEEAFLEEARMHDAWVFQLLRDEMDRDAYDMLIAVWTSPDRVSHVFWRYRDPEHPLYTEAGAAQYGEVVEETYERMDQVVGEVMGRLGPDDLLMVLSDHGFHSFRTGFSVNTWLARNGYLVLKDQTDPATAHTVSDDDLLRSVDWTQTRAYALGLGGVYLNLKGREGMGIVEAAEAPALAAAIREGLLAVTDPDTGARVFDAIYSHDVFTGRSAAKAPDLQLGYADGYQTSKASAKGAVPMELFEPNLDKWSGDHASSAMEHTPGILFANRPVAEAPAIIDLSGTALTYLGVDVPEVMEGRDLLAP